MRTFSLNNRLLQTFSMMIYSQNRYLSTKNRTTLSKTILNKSSFLANKVGITKEKARSQILTEKFKQTSLDSMKKSFDFLHNAGYTESLQTYPELLCIPESILKSRILLLKECSFVDSKIPWLLLNFESLPGKRLITLKNYGILPTNVNLTENFHRVCALPIQEYNSQVDDWITFRDLYCKVLKLYLKRELDLNDEEVEKVIKPVKWTSFRTLRYNIKILRDVLSFSSKEIMDGKSLLHADPENILSMLKQYKEINIKEAMKKYPKLALKSPETVSKNYQLLQENNITEIAATFPKLLALNSQLNLYRLSKVLETYPLQMYVNHPRFLLLVQRVGIARERLNIMKRMNMQCYSLNQLICRDDDFVGHLAIGVDKIPCHDKIQFLMRKIPYSRKEIHEELKKNPYLGYIPLHVISETLEFLKQMDFSAEDIFGSLQLVLYQRRVVEDAVIHKVPKLLKSLDYADDISVIKKKTILALALYCIEKDHNFSGSGVWNKAEVENTDLFID